MSERLKPCPWCGGEIEMMGYLPLQQWKWECRKCFCHSYTFDSHEAAIADANRRAPSRVEAEAVRLLMEADCGGEAYEWLRQQGLTKNAEPDWPSYRERYGEH